MTDNWADKGSLLCFNLPLVELRATFARLGHALDAETVDALATMGRLEARVAAEDAAAAAAESSSRAAS